MEICDNEHYLEQLDKFNQLNRNNPSKKPSSSARKFNFKKLESSPSEPENVRKSKTNSTCASTSKPNPLKCVQSSMKSFLNQKTSSYSSLNSSSPCGNKIFEENVKRINDKPIATVTPQRKNQDDKKRLEVENKDPVDNMFDDLDFACDDEDDFETDFSFRSANRSFRKPDQESSKPIATATICSSRKSDAENSVASSSKLNTRTEDWQNRIDVSNVNPSDKLSEYDDDDGEVCKRWRPKSKALIIDSDEENEQSSAYNTEADNLLGDEEESNVAQSQNINDLDETDFSIVDEDDLEYLEMPTPSPPQFDDLDDEDLLGDEITLDDADINIPGDDESTCDDNIDDPVNNQLSQASVSEVHRRVSDESTNAELLKIVNHPLYKSSSTDGTVNCDAQSKIEEWNRFANETVWNLLNKVDENDLKRIPGFDYGCFAQLRTVRSRIRNLENKFSSDSKKVSSLSTYFDTPVPKYNKSPATRLGNQNSPSRNDGIKFSGDSFKKPALISPASRLARKMSKINSPSNDDDVIVDDSDLPSSDYVRRESNRKTIACSGINSGNTQVMDDIDTQDLRMILDDDWDDDDAAFGRGQSPSHTRCEVDYTERLYDNVTKKQPRSNQADVRGKFLGNHRDDGASDEFKSHNFPHSQEMLNMFHQVFGLKKFRHNQLEAINAALLGEDCFILMPTGGGKSLCYMLPALVTSGVTVVISPLRSLIQDQVSHLSSLDVPADCLSGDQNLTASHQVYMKLQSKIPAIKLLYVTPEKISASPKVMSVLENLYKRNLLARFVIDEAHCVSNWGHDFRPDYKKLNSLRKNFPNVPFMALTATATPRVRIDVLHQLSMKKPKWFLQSFNRPNLKYTILPKKGKNVTGDVIGLIKKQFRNKSGIIYCLSRKECDQVAKDLRKDGISAGAYHAGLSDKNRSEIQDNWVNDKYKIVCATIAFGMGIDKADVRFVIHYSLPKSIEGYYQESGRAGRDGETSTCILYYNYHDMMRMRSIIEKGSDNVSAKKVHIDNLYKMVRYCENQTDCRRVQQLEYFGEIFDRSWCTSNGETACDNCQRRDSYDNCDVTDDCKAVAKCINDVVGTANRRKSSYTLTYFIDIFKGSLSTKIKSANHDRLELHGRGKMYHRVDAERLLRKMLFDSYIAEDLVITRHDQAVCYVKPGVKARDLMAGKCKVMFQMRKDSRKSLGATPVAVHHNDENTDIKNLQEECYQELVSLCKAIARERHMQYTYLLNMDALKQMSKDMPTSKDEMLRIPHVTNVNYDKFVHRFLDVTVSFSAKRNELEQVDETPWLQSDNFSDDIADSSQSNADNERKCNRGWKRKRNWANRGKYKRAKGNPRKNFTKSSKGSNNFSSKMASTSNNFGSSKLGFLNDAKPNAKSRSIFPNPRVSYI